MTIKKLLVLILITVGIVFPEPVLFPSRIYNNSLRDTYKSTHLIYPEAPGPETKAIVFLINGQQTTSKKTGDNADALYGSRLCGLTRTGGDTWDGGYKVYTDTDGKYKSIFSTLIEKYSNNVLFINILNPKYNYLMNKYQLKKTFRYVYTTVFMDQYKKINKKNIPVIFAGFSRGGVLSYLLSKKMIENNINVSLLITVDPVINWVKERYLMYGWGVQGKDDNWYFNKKHPEADEFIRLFPIFKEHPVSTWHNIFQITGNDHKSGIIPWDIGTGGKKAVPLKQQENNYFIEMEQLDFNAENHSPWMIENYQDIIVKLITSELNK
jgi:hypothetical protein